MKIPFPEEFSCLLYQSQAFFQVSYQWTCEQFFFPQNSLEDALEHKIPLANIFFFH